MQFRSVKKIGLALILVGISPLLYAEYKIHQHNWDPLITPVILKPGLFESPEFSTDLDGTYDIWLAFDPMKDIGREECLIGWDYQSSCKDRNITPSLNFSWVVNGDVKHAESEGTFKIQSIRTGPETGLGSFDAKRGGHQRIILNIFSDAGELNLVHPRLKVEAATAYWEKWVIFGQMAWVFAFFVGVPSSILMFVRPKLKAD